MAAQLAKLAEFARRPRVIAELARQPAVAYLDSVLDGQTVQDPAMVEMAAVVSARPSRRSWFGTPRTGPAAP